MKRTCGPAADAALQTNGEPNATASDPRTNLDRFIALRTF
jgi:hypothetical protein